MDHLFTPSSFLNPSPGSCLWNAAGCLCTSEEELLALNEASTGAIVTKSATPKSREGNPLPRYAQLPYGSINSMGLPNKGVDFYIHFIEKNQHLIHKPYILSIAGLAFDDYRYLAQKAAASPFLTGLEVNLSCPNIVGKPQIGYDFEAVARLLDLVYKIYQRPFGVKLPPYFDMVHFEAMSAILRQVPLLYICCINSIGNGLWVDISTETAAIKPRHGYGGLGGAYVKPTALANVRHFYTSLSAAVPIIGCGGVQTGQDVFEHILCGASAVQVGTTLYEEGIACFTRLTVELEQVMRAKNYSSLDQFRGKLKTWG